MSNKDLPKDVLLVRALMTLKNVNAQELAVHAGVQTENLYAWLNGTASALSKKSYIALLSYLGLTQAGFSKGFVQNWSISVGGKFTSEQLTLLEHVSPWLAGGALMEIAGDWQPLHGKSRVFAIRGEHFKILLSLKGGFRMPFALEPEHIPGISYRVTDTNSEPKILVDALYWNAVRNQAITPAEFDDLFFETALECSWNDLRLMARERGITPSMLAKDILSKDLQLENSAQAKVEVEERIAITVEAATTVAAANTQAMTAPARTRRRKTETQVEEPSAPTSAPETSASSAPISEPDFSPAPGSDLNHVFGSSDFLGTPSNSPKI